MHEDRYTAAIFIALVAMAGCISDDAVASQRIVVIGPDASVATTDASAATDANAATDVALAFCMGNTRLVDKAFVVVEDTSLINGKSTCNGTTSYGKEPFVWIRGAWRAGDNRCNADDANGSRGLFQFDLTKAAFASVQSATLTLSATTDCGAEGSCPGRNRGLIKAYRVALPWTQGSADYKRRVGTMGAPVLWTATGAAGLASVAEKMGEGTYEPSMETFALLLDSTKIQNAEFSILLETEDASTQVHAKDRKDQTQAAATLTVRGCAL
jgi:hypothetical protein